jgi:uncharacterized Zn finger protein (UPF0148 family)
MDKYTVKCPNCENQVTIDIYGSIESQLQYKNGVFTCPYCQLVSGRPLNEDNARDKQIIEANAAYEAGLKLLARTQEAQREESRKASEEWHKSIAELGEENEKRVHAWRYQEKYYIRNGQVVSE